MTIIFIIGRLARLASIDALHVANKIISLCVRMHRTNSVQLEWGDTRKYEGKNH